MFLNISKSFFLGACAIIIAAILWSLDGTLIRPNFYEFPAINIVFIEHLFGAILLSPFIFWGWNRIKSISKSTLGSLLWVSVFGGLLGTLMITEAYFAAFRGETTLSTVIILQKLQPVFALLLAGVLLKERLTKRFYIFAGLAIFSAYMIAYGSLGKEIFNISLGNNAALYAFLAAFAFGSSTVFGKNLVSDLGFRVSTALRFTLTTILAGITVLIFGDMMSISNFTGFHWQLLIFIACTSGAGALFLYYFGLKKVAASNATIFELAWPLSGIFFDWYFNGNILNSTQIIFSIILLISFFMIIEEHKNN
ncbi:DMT family transporter [Candidatus Gracilibacteria bacterium]|nr:DMT family transporter [Candidatus Gracilibacteria bacterium]